MSAFKHPITRTELRTAIVCAIIIAACIATVKIARAYFPENPAPPPVEEPQP